MAHYRKDNGRLHQGVVCPRGHRWDLHLETTVGARLHLGLILVDGAGVHFIVAFSIVVIPSRLVIYPVPPVAPLDYFVVVVGGELLKDLSMRLEGGRREGGKEGRREGGRREGGGRAAGKRRVEMIWKMGEREEETGGDENVRRFVQFQVLCVSVFFDRILCVHIFTLKWNECRQFNANFSISHTPSRR